MKKSYQTEKSADKIIRSAFFERDPLACARELIRTELIWGECSGTVVEVEAYAAIDDEAAHTFTRSSARSFIERNKAGAAYIYLGAAAGVPATPSMTFPSLLSAQSNFGIAVACGDLDADGFGELVEKTSRPCFTLR